MFARKRTSPNVGAPLVGARPATQSPEEFIHTPALTLVKLRPGSITSKLRVKLSQWIKNEISDQTFAAEPVTAGSGYRMFIWRDQEGSKLLLENLPGEGNSVSPEITTAQAIHAQTENAGLKDIPPTIIIHTPDSPKPMMRAKKLILDYIDYIRSLPQSETPTVRVSYVLQETESLPLDNNEVAIKFSVIKFSVERVSATPVFTPLYPGKQYTDERAFADAYARYKALIRSSKRPVQKSTPKEVEMMPSSYTPDFIEGLDLLETMQDIFKSGYIQLLPEEMATSKLLLETSRDSTQEYTLMSLLYIDEKQPLPLSTDLDFAHTALAFCYTCHYADEVVKYAEKQKIGGQFEETIKQELQTSACTQLIRARALKAALESKGGVLTNAVNFLFSKSAYKSDQCGFKTVIQGGTAQPLIKLTGEMGIDSPKAVQEALNNANLNPVSAEEWGKRIQPPHELFRMDVSSLNLSYKGQLLKSIESVGTRANKAIVTSYSRITTAGGQNYLDEDKPQLRLVPLRYFLPGNCFEYDATAMERRSTAEDTHWQGKEADWRLGLGGNRDTYYGEVHPKITQYALNLLSTMDLGGKTGITILDVAGGNGDLGERLLKEAQDRFPALKFTYVLVDYSQEDVAVANERFKTLVEKSGKRIQAKAHCKDMFDYNFNAVSMKQDLGLPETGVELVINSGGLLNNQIGNEANGPRKFNLMYAQLMALNGGGVYSGLTPLLINSRDHRDSQLLTVLNLHDSETDRQMHVVQKKM